MQPNKPDDKLAIARLGAPKGVRGDLRVQSYSGEVAHIKKLGYADLQGEGRSLRLKVLRCEGIPSDLTIAFEGYPSPETARILTGLDIVVPREAAAPLADNEWYVTDLVGIAIVGEDGKELGRVKGVLSGGPDPWLETLLPGGRVALVPFRKEFVGAVDIEAGTAVLVAPWILEEE
ncbi:MAG: 16S rRNA processing protein RimM [Spirochaetaceae bacterium]|nr:16S rRNA processing protein RimM [Spirochaetaceae bacterium]